MEPNMMIWQGESITRDVFIRDVLPGLQQTLEADLRNALNQQFRLEQLKDVMPNADPRFLQSRIESWNQAIEGFQDTLKDLGRIAEQDARALRSQMATNPGVDIVRSGKDTLSGEAAGARDSARALVAENEGWLARTGNAIGRMGQQLQATGVRIAESGRALLQRVGQQVSGIMSGVLATWRASSLRAALVELTAALVRGFPGGVPGLVVSLIVTALIAATWSNSRSPDEAPSTDPMRGVVVYAMVARDDRVTVRMSPYDTGRDPSAFVSTGEQLLAGPSEFAQVKREFCAGMDSGSARQEPSKAWSLSFRGRRLTISDLDLQMLECR